jgi:hypothetical protein
MTRDLAGEIRCPSCGRPTPLAPFCTHCGSVIPEGAAARPHAMSREELEERIRERRSLENPFRRGEPEAAEPAGAWVPPQRPQAFVPEPADELAREGHSPEEDPQRIDYFDDRRQAGDRPAPGPDRDAMLRGAGGIPGAALPPSAASWPSRDLIEPSATGGSEDAQPSVPQHVAEAWTATPDRALGDSSASPSAGYGGGSYSARAYGGDGYGGGGYGDRGYGDGSGYDSGQWDDGEREPPRRGSAMLPILGFVILGIAALLGGGFLFSALNSPTTLAQQTATPSATPSEPVGSPSASPSDSGASASAGATTTPVPQPDNFSAQARPCATSKMGFDGCDVDGTTLDRGQVWIWVGFKNGQASNVIGVTIANKATGDRQDGSAELDKIGCNPDKPCSGYINVAFDGLDPGEYTIQVTRDGDQVATSGFTVKA